VSVGLGRVAVRAAIASLWLILLACPGERARPRDAERRPEPPPGEPGDRYLTRDGILYGVTSGGPVALVAVYGAGPARDTLPLAWPAGVEPRAGFMIGDRIAAVVPSPHDERALFWTSGVHSLVAVVRLDSAGVRALDFLLEVTPVEAIWAPFPRYVALVTATPRGEGEVRVYDVRAGQRLALPWESECERVGSCAVSRVGWEGGSLLTVELRMAEDEVPVPYEVDVAALVPREPGGEDPS
jgi:hypothetical protein